MSSTPMRILVTAQAFAVSGTAYRERLGKLGCQVVDAKSWGPLTLSSLIEQAQGCDAIIAAVDPYCDAAFEALPRLKLVARCGIGIDSVDLVSATEHGIMVTNVPDAMTDAVADYCMGLLLSMARHIHIGYTCMQQGGWAEFPGVELRGKTLGLVGFGRIGQAVATRALGFGLSIAVHDPWMQSSIASGKLDDPVAALASRVRWLELSELLEQSDFVSIHAPNTPETRHMINRQALAKMRQGAYLINTARGALVDPDALMQAVRTGQIAGAAMDVYEQEPLPAEHPLRSTPNLLLTPHNAFNSREAAVRMSIGCYEPILDILEGRAPKCLCNPDVLKSTSLRVKQWTL
jgi:phosphoglycerate dehydrogenase-like enzyme